MAQAALLVGMLLLGQTSAMKAKLCQMHKIMGQPGCLLLVPSLTLCCACAARQQGRLRPQLLARG